MRQLAFGLPGRFAVLIGMWLVFIVIAARIYAHLAGRDWRHSIPIFLAAASEMATPLTRGVDVRD